MVAALGRLRELASPLHLGRLALDRYVHHAEGVLESSTHDGNCEVRYVDPNPAPIQLLGRDQGGATAAERIEHSVAWIGGSPDDPLEQSSRLLSGVTQELFRPIIDDRDVCPNVLDSYTGHLIEIPLVLRHSTRPRLDNAALPE